MARENRPSQKEFSSSNHQFSGDMLVWSPQMGTPRKLTCSSQWNFLLKWSLFRWHSFIFGWVPPWSLTVCPWKVSFPIGKACLFFRGQLLVLGRVNSMVNKSPKDRVVGPLPNGLFWLINLGSLPNHLLTGKIHPGKLTSIPEWKSLVGSGVFPIEIVPFLGDIR